MNKVLILTLLLSGVAVAQEQEADLQGEVGSLTRHWLELQRSGQMATTQPDRLTPAAAQKVTERMVESFSHPIPEYFAEDSFGEK
ncbi:hypothetical protein A8C75_20045 [Marinobacterium aestuarii]|uniref:DUF3613 domain-containing protein n=1 Tax=Marinobacterium aestuarii TaxID=1821621 RepID=A0A1A9F2Z5_9GAMM|nr:DUF3613 domain-containing protein [Marinobacterium aestuarii]ANG64535.1 hypothetical protein A8C75_20045 [Marinobacterium aestuarii]